MKKTLLELIQYLEGELGRSINSYSWNFEFSNQIVRGVYLELTADEAVVFPDTLLEINELLVYSLSSKEDDEYIFVKQEIVDGPNIFDHEDLLLVNNSSLLNLPDILYVSENGVDGSIEMPIADAFKEAF